MSCLHVHYLPCRGIDLVLSLVPELNRQPKIFKREHVPHLRLPHWAVGAGELEHASQRIVHISWTTLWYHFDRNTIRFTLLGYNRVVRLRTDNRNEREGTQNVSVETPNEGKNHGSPRTAEYDYMKVIQRWRRKRWWSLFLHCFTARWLQHKQQLLSLSHTHSLYTQLRSTSTYVIQLYNTF